MRVLLVGDTHGETGWFRGSALPAAARVQAHAVVVVGDFGFWPGRDGGFLDVVRAAPLPVFFLDGNHEDHSALDLMLAQARAASGVGECDPVPFGGALMFLPRGARWVWGGVSFAACGGARSIDRTLRTPGLDWFPQEAASHADLARTVAGGPCQVLLTHDAPLCAPVPLAPLDRLPQPWRDERPACDEHRSRLDPLLDALRPQLLVHGHYHRAWDGDVDRPWGRVRAVGLAEAGRDVGSACALLELGGGSWSLRPPIDPAG